MSPEIDPIERITRYLRHGSQMRCGEKRPNYKAYMPMVADGSISVYRTADLSKAEIATLGSTYVATPISPLKGYCCLVAVTVFAQGLDVEYAPHPHERHANLTGWRTDPKNRIIAKALADTASLTEY